MWSNIVQINNCGGISETLGGKISCIEVPESRLIFLGLVGLDKKDNEDGDFEV